MTTPEWVQDTLTLRGREIRVKTGMIEQSALFFYPDNPRIYSIIGAGEREPSQAEIEERLLEMDHVKQLIHSIRANGGLTDPLIVRDGDHLVVLEGNSRLAAYRHLAQGDPIKWGKVKCKLLPEKIGEDLVFALLGEYHIIGRKDWAPYEQAGYLYRCHKNHGKNIPEMAEEMGIKATEVQHMIEVYTFMLDQQDNDVNRWSYYDEYLKSRAIKKVRAELPDLDKVVVAQIKSGDISRAVDIRDKLKVVADVRPKLLSKFVGGRLTLDDCFGALDDAGLLDEWYRRFHKFRNQLADSNVSEAIQKMTDEERGKCIFELKRIKRSVDALLKKADK